MSTSETPMMNNNLETNTEDDFKVVSRPNLQKYSSRGFKSSINCAKCIKEFHSTTDINTNGHLSHNLDMWFCSVYCYQHHCFDESIHAYDKPEHRSQFIHIFTESNSRKNTD